MKKVFLFAITLISLTLSLIASPDLTHYRQVKEGDHISLQANVIAFIATSGEMITGELVNIPAGLDLREGDRIKVGVLENNKLVLLEVRGIGAGNGHVGATSSTSINGNAGDRMETSSEFVKEWTTHIGL